MRKASFLICALVVSATLLLSACSEPPAQVGGFCIAASSDYSVREANPLSDVVVNGQIGISKCDSIVTSSESDASISASWYDGVSYHQAKVYFEKDAAADETNATGESAAESGGNVDTSQSAQRPSLISDWVEYDKRIVEVGEILLNCGNPATIYEYSVGDGLGDPYSAVCRIAIFPTGENSIGVIEYFAYSDEQVADMSELFSRVLENIA